MLCLPPAEMSSRTLRLAKQRFTAAASHSTSPERAGPKITHTGDPHTSVLFVTAADFNVQSHERSRETVTLARLHPGETRHRGRRGRGVFGE